MNKLSEIFSIMSLPISFVTDRKVLDARYTSCFNLLQVLPAPIQKTHLEKLNNAYHILKNPEALAIYFLKDLDFFEDVHDLFDDMDMFLEEIPKPPLDFFIKEVLDDFQKGFETKNSYCMHLAYAKLKKLGRMNRTF